MVIAYTLIKTETGKDYQVFALVKRYNEVKEIALTYGAFDLIVKIEVDSTEVLDTFIFDILRKIPEVKETMTLITSRTEKGSVSG